MTPPDTGLDPYGELDHVVARGRELDHVEAQGSKHALLAEVSRCFNRIATHRAEAQQASRDIDFSFVRRQVNRAEECQNRIAALSE